MLLILQSGDGGYNTLGEYNLLDMGIANHQYEYR